MKRHFIGITGASSSGKSSIVKHMYKNIKKKSLVISLDSFYKTVNTVEQKAEEYNFDIPTSIDFELFKNVIQNIKSNKNTIYIPVYDFKTHKRISIKEIDITDITIFIIEGIFIYYYQNIRNLFDIKFFVDTDLDICLLRRIKRDIKERGRTIDLIIDRYLKFVKPSYTMYILPMKQYCNIIIPYGQENYKFLDMYCNIINNFK